MEQLFTCFSCTNVLNKNKAVCLRINGTQSVRLEKGTIEFNCFFQTYTSSIQNLFWFWVYSKQCWKLWRFLLKKKYKVTFLVLLLTNFSKLIVVYRDKNVAYKFIKAILEKYQYCKKVMKKTFQQKFDHDWRWRRKFFT